MEMTEKFGSQFLPHIILLITVCNGSEYHILLKKGGTIMPTIKFMS